MTRGTTTASPVALRPILRAEDQTAAPVTSGSGERPGVETGCPQWVSRADSCAAMSARNSSAAATNFTQGTPPFRMLTEAV